MISPLRFFVILCMVGRISGHRAPRWLRSLATALAIALIALMTPLAANTLVRVQEARIPMTCGGTPQAIVLLTSGVVEPPRSRDDFAALDTASMHRLAAAATLYKSRPMPVAIMGSSGYDVADSTVMEALAHTLGMAQSDLRAETLSSTTWENAESAANMHDPLPPQIWLVTSALHMPRSLFAFQATGFQPCAWPARSEYRAFDGVGYLMPNESAAIKSGSVLHEWLGEIVYRLRASRRAR
jgi:uncharacterized SAM-binding protein YcdF (DUF218 family)